MKKRVIVCLVPVLVWVCSIGQAAAPVEEAHEYVPNPVPEQAAVAGKPSRGFSLSHLPKVRWKDSLDQEAPQKVHLALREASTPVDDLSSADMTSDQRLMYLDQRVDKLMKMDVPEVVNNLQQQITWLRDQLEAEGRTIESLQSRQKILYKRLKSQPAQLHDRKNQLDTPMPQVSAKENTDTGAYQVAFDQLMNKQYARAEQSFNQYLQAYPQGRYRGNVNYWLGEIALIEKKYPQAETAFSQVASQYPHSGKVADANYKLAITHLKMGKVEQAKSEFLAIEKNSAGNTVAHLAKLQLQQIG
jgi:tol-pal system protein YbgF